MTQLVFNLISMLLRTHHVTGKEGGQEIKRYNIRYKIKLQIIKYRF